jgi:hypothetical protein
MHSVVGGLVPLVPALQAMNSVVHSFVLLVLLHILDPNGTVI